MYPTNSKSLIECYDDATTREYGYLLMDLTQSTDNKFRIQSGITPGETRIIYEPKNIK